MDHADDQSVYNEITKAIKSKDMEEFERLIRDNPEWSPQKSWLGYPHDVASSSGLAMFKAYLKHFPQTKNWDCGERGDVVGISAMAGDVPVLKYCLEELGHNANEGRILYFPVSSPCHNGYGILE